MLCTPKQVDSLKAALTDSRRRMGAQPRTLRQQWRRTVMLNDATRILGDVQAVTEVPSKVDACLAQRDWPGAVTCLLDGCGKAGREEMAKIRALAKIKEDMVARYRILQEQITGEVQKRMYTAWLTEAEPPYTPHSRTPQRSPNVRRVSGTQPVHQHWSSLAAISEGELGSARKWESSLTHGSQTAHTSTGVASEGSTPPSTPLTMKELVDCMAQMGCIQDFKVSIDRGLQLEISKAVVKAMQGMQKNRTNNRDISVAGSVSGQQSTVETSIPDDVTRTAHRMLKMVFGKCHNLLRSTVKLFEILGSTDVPVESAGVEFLRSQQRKQESTITTRPSQGSATQDAKQQSGENEGIGALTGSRYVDAACLRAWDCIQDECLLLVANILNVPLRNLGLKSVVESQDAGWLARLENEKSGRGKGKGQDGSEKRASKLTFSFGLQVDGVSPAEKSSIKGDVDAPSHSQLVWQVLNHSGGIYLTPVVYKAIHHLNNAAIKTIQDALERFESGLASRSQALQVPHQRLRQFIDDFVMETFLPQVWVDFRGRCTAALEDPEAFRPQARTRTSTLLESTENALPVASITANMVQEVCSWATSMRPFASSLTGVLENILGRVQDAFFVNIQQALGDTACSKLATSQEIASLMGMEEAASLLPDSTSFTLMTPTDGPDSSQVPSPSALSGVEGDVAENEILQAVLNMRPFAPEGLVCRQGNFHRLVELAAMSDSLECMAAKMDSVVQSIEPSSPPSTGPLDSGRMKGKVKPRQISLNWSDGLSIGLAMLSDRYRSLAGLCVRALRLEMICLCTHHLSELTQISHLCEDNERRDAPASLGSLIRHAARAEEDIAPHLSPSKHKYIFGVLPSASTKIMMRLLPEFKHINLAGVERLTKLVSILQQAIISLLSPNSVMTPGATRIFDHARSYFSLLNLSAKEVLAFAQERPNRYLGSEWRGLFEVLVAGRWVGEEDNVLMERIADKGLDIRARPSKKAFSSLSRTARH